MTTRTATIPTAILAAMALAALPATALAQPAITIDVENPELMPGQSTTVTLLGGYGGTDFAVAGVATNLITSVGSEGWSDAMRLDPMAGPGTSAGSASATGWNGIIAGQLNFPGGAGIFADPTNPIAFWSVTYTAPLVVTAPFEIDLSTLTTRYDVFIASESTLSESRLAELTEGSATIHVIPAPASALVLALGAVALRRRR
jgi:hypothetical protein